MTQKKEAFDFGHLVLTLTGKFGYPFTEAFLPWYQALLLQNSNVD